MIKKVGCPPPITDVCPEPEEEVVEPGKKADKAQASLKKKPQPKCKNKPEKPKSKAVSVGPADGTYCAGSFRDTFQKYVAGKKAEGLSYKEAAQSWKESDVRAKLLANLSTSELKKRRFV